MVTYLTRPDIKLTLKTTEYENSDMVSANIVRVENGIDSATVIVQDYKNKHYGTLTTDIVSTTTVDPAVQVDIKDYCDAAYTTMFKGIARNPVPLFSASGDILKLVCDGSGYGLSEMFVKDEYGSQSENPTLDTITEILTDAGEGIITEYVNDIMNTAVASGYAYNTASIETIADVIKYVVFPLKPASKCINDLCDLVTAKRYVHGPPITRTAGPHWIVTTDDKVRLKVIGATQVGWTKYYGDSQAASTLEEGIDFESYSIENLGSAYNYIHYHGLFRTPGNADFYTENQAANWGSDANVTPSDSGTCIVGSASLRLECPGGIGGYAWWPSTDDAAWDFDSTSTPTQIPTINFYASVTDNLFAGFAVGLRTGAGAGYTYTFDNTGTDFPAVDKWYHWSFPIGPYYTLSRNFTKFKWTTAGAHDWGNINRVDFFWDEANTEFVYIDGLHLGNVPIIRVATDSTMYASGAKKPRMKLITDHVGKDDSLVASDDTGTMAQLAAAELLRQHDSVQLIKMNTPIIPDLLPGQYVHVHAKKKADDTWQIDKDFRVYRLTHSIAKDCRTIIEATDDVLNSRVRLPYEDVNKVMGDMRPEYQDRQASSLKSRGIDIKVATFIKDYGTP